MSSRLFSWLPLRVAPEPSTSWVLSATLIAFLGFFWFVLTAGEDPAISPVALPSPVDVLREIPSFISDRQVFTSVAISLFRLMTGFFLAVAIAIPLGILAASQRSVESLLRPFNIALRNIPIAALIPLTLAWFGIAETQKVMFIFIACFPFLFADASNAVLNVPERYVDTARTLGANAKQIVMRVLVPLAAPSIFQSVRSLFGLAFGYIMLAETINAKSGIGSLINISQRLGKPEHVYLSLIVIGVVAFLIDRALGLLERKLFPHLHT